MLGCWPAGQVWHCPIVEYVDPVQATHVGGSSDDGPCPAPHGRHVVRSPFTTLGRSQTVHSTPNAEYVAPSHATQAVRSAFGASPAPHARHVWKLSSTMFGATHSTHCPVVEYVVPLQLTQPV